MNFPMIRLSSDGSEVVMAPAQRKRMSDDRREAAAFGPRLRRLRQAAGLTLKELGALAGLAVSTISKI